MLTNEALHERKWGHYPSLGRLHGEHPIPSRLYGFSSASDNLFSRLNRLAEVAVTTREHAESIRAVTDAELSSRLPIDLERLEHELHEASSFFTEHAEFIGRLCREAYEQEHRRRHEAEEAEIQRRNSNDRNA